MIKTCLVLSEDSLLYLKQRTAGRGRGQSAIVEALIQCDKVRRETRQLLEREQELSTRQSWQDTGVNVD